MYRDWREITKSILAKKKKNPGQPAGGIPRSKLQRPESRLYRHWVEAEIDKNPDEFKDFAEGKGIIATRERFLTWLASEEGQAALETGKVASAEPELKTDFKKTVIVPIAVPGCGKSTFRLERTISPESLICVSQVKRPLASLFLTSSAGVTPKAMMSRRERLARPSPAISSIY